MHVLVDAANDEDFVVVADGLGAEKLLGLLEGAVHALDLVLLGVESEAVGDPAVVATKDEDLAIVEGEAAHSVACTPIVLTVHEVELLPSLVFQVTAPVKALDAVQGLLVLRVAATDDVDVARLEHANGVIVSRLVELGDLRPLVLGNLVNFALLGGLVRELGADSEKEVLRAILESLVQVGKLMTRATIFHAGATLSLIGLLVNDEAIGGDDGANLVFFLLATDAEDLVVDLNRREVFWQNLSVA
mmetsp:Transcript_25042/g.31340  ORF Transcript_25042/g.31340 Transcript_25042/m.31340 type:complete len:246 (-) Transcript_25042:854-1591(-)|eukprot:CAMPEP_0170457164 /NCGR_PEP_ID=MMETSP0123-20130129/4547_1 /TAXON_ID=182087 /ORGANISM="Favella ehrenbergii, Strain Fehren 1" /LENGTH=245 /DNA_ID=CAMNT_0010720865 /DNA_START=240 /DNA_END=977 /DNA_ORIENTATION=-